MYRHEGEESGWYGHCAAIDPLNSHKSMSRNVISIWDISIFRAAPTQTEMSASDVLIFYFLVLLLLSAPQFTI